METRKAHLAHEVHAAESNSKSKSYKPDTWTFWTSPFDHRTLFSGTVGQWLCSVSQRAFALIRRAEALWRCAIGTPQSDGKREGCVLSRSKVHLLFRIIEISSKKKLIYRETTLRLPKTSRLSCENALVLHSSSQPLRESRPPNLPHLARFLRAHERAPERTRTCTSRTQRVCFFCLHPSPSPPTHCLTADYVWRKRSI